MPKIIVPWRDHAPPRSSGAEHCVTAVPPAAGTVFSLPSAKNAMVLLSGDQNGYAAPGVPSSGTSRSESSRRTNSPDCLPTLNETTMVLPSGDTTGGPSKRPGSAVADPLGIGTLELTEAGADVRGHSATATATTAATVAVAASAASAYSRGRLMSTATAVLFDSASSRNRLAHRRCRGGGDWHPFPDTAATRAGRAPASTLAAASNPVRAREPGRWFLNACPPKTARGR